MVDYSLNELFLAKDFGGGKENVIGFCNGYSSEERWNQETPIFARKIGEFIKEGDVVLDYGCGIGRLAKNIQDMKDVEIIGIDTSESHRKIAGEYVRGRFKAIKPEELNESVDLVYCIYVLQHIPAIDLKSSLQRIWTFLKEEGLFIYCSSDIRMAMSIDENKSYFVNDAVLGVNIRKEIEKYFELVSELFTKEEVINAPKILGDMLFGKDFFKDGKLYNGIPHPSFLYRKKKIKGYLFNV